MSTTSITRLTGLNVQPEAINGTIAEPYLHGFYVPSLTTAQITTLAASTEMRDGVLVYDNELEAYKVRQNGVLYTLNSSVATVTGVGLTSGTPFIFPSGPAAAVEVAANQVNGFTYYNTTANTMRTYFNGAWSGWAIP